MLERKDFPTKNTLESQIAAIPGQSHSQMIKHVGMSCPPF